MDSLRLFLFRPAYQEYAPNTMYSSVGGAYYQTAGSQVRDITITVYIVYSNVDLIRDSGSILCF